MDLRKKPIKEEGNDMKKLTVFIALSILLLVTSAVGAVTLPFSDNFESYTVGQAPPSPWFNLAGGEGQ